MPKKKRRRERRRKPIRNRERRILDGAVRHAIEDFARENPDLSAEEFSAQALKHVEEEFEGYRGHFWELIMELAKRWIPIILEAWLGGRIGS